MGFSDTIPEMWERLNKLIKPNGAIVLFGSEPFSSALRMSNIKNYKYDWVWVRNNATKYLSRSYNPLSIYETISVFLKNENEELGIYLKQKRLEKGLSKKYLDNKLGSNTLYSFFEGRNLRGVITYSKISITHYEVLKLLLNLDDRYDEYIVTIRPDWKESWQWERVPIGNILSAKDANIIAEWLQTAIPGLWKIFQNINN